MTTEEDIRRIAQEEFDRLSYNYYRRNYPNFNITSGHNTDNHGKSEYVMSTDTGQGIEFFKQGNCKIVGRKSIELSAGDLASDKDVCISIRAQDGHIVIEAKNGDLTLKGNNIILEATDADGTIEAKPGKVFKVKAPEIDLEGTKFVGSATMDMLLAAGELSMYSESGPIKQGDGTQSIISSSVFSTVFTIVDKARQFFKR